MTPSQASKSQASRKRHVLLIEDSAPDALMTEMVHDEVQHCSTLDIVMDGDAALRYLKNEENTPTGPARTLLCSISRCRESLGSKCCAGFDRRQASNWFP